MLRKFFGFYDLGTIDILQHGERKRRSRSLRYLSGFVNAEVASVTSKTCSK